MKTRIKVLLAIAGAAALIEMKLYDVVDRLEATGDVNGKTRFYIGKRSQRMWEFPKD